ncbi:MAG TPA: DUF5317 domain-containing protein [Actinomycetota bacterium]|nr:DUF5317 domain-containing protein [Actinomycetota bacterium]
MLLLAFMSIGLLLGWGLGGAARNLASVRILLWPVLPVAVALQVVPIPAGEQGIGRYLPFAALVASFVLLAVVTAANWRLKGFLLILAGVVLNAIPIIANQGMPVSGSAIVDVGGSVEDIPTEPGGKHHLSTNQDDLVFLGDVFPVRAPFREVVSLGDLVMYAGAAWFLAAAMLGRPERPPPKPAGRLRRAQPSTMWESPR